MTQLKTILTVLGFALGLAALAMILFMGRTTDSTAGRSGSVSAEDPISSTLKGAGSTFIQPLMARWLREYSDAVPVPKVEYEANGSAAGVAEFSTRSVQFGVTEAPMTDAQITAAKGDPLHVPLALGAVVPSYNLPRPAHPLRFTPAILAGIFLGQIKIWTDSAIALANPDLALPATPIVVVHRSDGSGTTYVWTDYLTKVSSDWAGKVGRGTSVDWPTGSGAPGNEGVAQAIRQTQGSIGYLELAYARQNKIDLGEIQNAAGRFVEATAESITAAAAGALSEVAEDLRYSMTNSPEPAAWPVSGTTWAVFDRDMRPEPTRAALAALLRWMIHQGQADCASLGYAPLPAVLVDTVDPRLMALARPPSAAAEGPTLAR